MRPVVAIALACGLLAGTAGTAQAVTLVAPVEGELMSPTPTFSWQLAPDEQTVLIEWTKNPALGPGGEFVNHPSKSGDNLEGPQTRYTVPAAWQLTAGRWWWRVEARDPDFIGRSSAVRSFDVRDRQPRIKKVAFSQFRCLRVIQARFTYLDNSDAGARASVELFERSRGGRPLARGSLGRTRAPGRGGSATESRSFARPRRVREGRTYFARLVVRDSAGQVARSKRKRIRIPRC